MLGDADGNGTVNNFDIEAFVVCLTRACPPCGIVIGTVTSGDPVQHRASWPANGGIDYGLKIASTGRMAYIYITDKYDVPARRVLEVHSTPLQQRTRTAVFIKLQSRSSDCSCTIQRTGYPEAAEAYSVQRID